MSFFSQEQLDGLSVSRMIFHVVGPDQKKMVLLEEAEPGPFADFFLARIRSTNGGIMFDFADGSPLELSLRKVEADAHQFVAETKGLATQFQIQHSANASAGVFMVFVLQTMDERFYALVKYDHETVLSYEIEDTPEGHKAAIAELHDTFVKAPEALQKSALIRLKEDGGELCIRDRASPSKVSKYFQAFLGARRRFEAAQLTTTLCGIAKKVALKNSELLGTAVMSNLTHRIYDFVQNTQSFDPSQKEPFLVAVFGSLVEDSPVRADFDRELKTARIESETFDFHKASFPRPAKRRLVTAEGIELIWDRQFEDKIIREPQPDGRLRIIIETGSIRSEDDYAERNSKTR